MSEIIDSATLNKAAYELLKTLTKEVEKKAKGVKKVDIKITLIDLIDGHEKEIDLFIINNAFKQD